MRHVDPSIPGDRSTYFAPAGRSSDAQLKDQMRRSLHDPCVEVVLEAITGFILILNENRQILAANQELLDALGWRGPSVIGLRPGEALNCAHFTDGTDGCGTSEHCASCGAVLAVLAARAKGAPAEDECHLSVYRDGELKPLDFRVRATPLEINGQTLTAFVFHDISVQSRREMLERTQCPALRRALFARKGVGRVRSRKRRALVVFSSTPQPAGTDPGAYVRIARAAAVRQRAPG